MATIVDPNQRNTAIAGTGEKATLAVAGKPVADPIKLAGTPTPTDTGLTVKKGPTLDQALKNYFGEKRYNAAKTDEEKDKLTVEFFQWLRENGSIDERRQFELYRARAGNDLNQYNRVSRTVQALDGDHQVDAARTVITQGSDDQRRVGVRAVADTYHHYNPQAQKPAAQLVVGSRDPNAIKTAAGHASGVDKGNQVGVVNIFAGAKLDKENQLAVNRTLIDQYGQFEKENQVDIHRIMSNTEYAETTKYAASNIYLFDKSNQVAAFEITYKTGNQDAIKAAQYDSSLKNEINYIVQKYNNEAEDKPLNNNAGNSNSDNPPPANGIASAGDPVVQKVAASIGNANSVEIKSIIKDCNETQILALINNFPGNVDVIKSIMDLHPNLTILSEISKVVKDPDVLRQIGIERVASQVPFMDNQTQKVAVREAARQGKFGLLRADYLGADAKSLRAQLMDEMNNHV